MGEPSVRDVQDELLHSTGILRAALLLLLHERPGHGYDLIARVKQLGLDRGDRAVYRGLQSMEQAKLVESAWDMPQAGAARRVYHLTPAGEESLRLYAQEILGLSKLLGDFLGRFMAETAQEPGSAPAQASRGRREETGHLSRLRRRRRGAAQPPPEAGPADAGPGGGGPART